MTHPDIQKRYGWTYWQWMAHAIVIALVAGLVIEVL